MSLHSDVDGVFSLKGRRVWVAGHTGMVGSAIVRRLKAEECHIMTVSHADVDLTRQRETERWIADNRPDVIFVAAAKVGGIAANATFPADFLYVNTMIAMNIMRAATVTGTERLLWMGSSCIYPKFADQPIREDALLSGPLEPTNEAYAIAKIAALKSAQFYATQYGVKSISIMPTNLYGPNDNFDPQKSHVIPALLRKMHAARMEHHDTVEIWGSGNPLREFLHVDDLADASVFLLKNLKQADIVNVGSGHEISVRDLARLVADIVGFKGTLSFDTSKPDGAPRKLLDSSTLKALGWKPQIALRQGLEDVYARWQSSTLAAAE